MIGLGLGTATFGALITSRRARAADGDAAFIGTTNVSSNNATIFANGVGDALRGSSGSSDHAGVVGESTNLSGGTGVLGTSENGAGVHGIGVTGDGVLGESDTGKGVSGVSRADRGVTGVSQTGIGVWGYSPDGYALAAEGRLLFDRSGVATVAAGRSKVRVRVRSGVMADSFVLATLQAVRAGVTVAGVVIDPDEDRFTIHLNRPVGRDTRVAWMVLR